MTATERRFFAPWCFVILCAVRVSDPGSIVCYGFALDVVQTPLFAHVQRDAAVCGFHGFVGQCCARV